MQIITSFLDHLQRKLFPALEEELGPLSGKQRRLVALLGIVRIEDHVPAPRRGFPGRPEENRQAIARAFVAKAVFNFSATGMLIEQLQGSASLRRICGWEKRNDVPSEATFSRVFSEFAKGELPQRVHAAMVEGHVKPRLVGHISRDATAIVAREKPISKAKLESKEEKPKRGRGRPRKGEEVPKKEPTRLSRQAQGMSLSEMIADLPKVCDIGCKRNSKGSVEFWVGYKLHVDWADGGIPVSCLLTSASVYDNQVAIPLMEMTASRVTSLYELMDAAYDAKEIDERCRRLGHVPIIDRNSRGHEKKEMEPATARRFEERTTAERGFGREKDEFGGRTVRVRGAVKVMAHLMYGILALMADQLIRFVT
jgi:hypothetical protein